MSETHRGEVISTLSTVETPQLELADAEEQAMLLLEQLRADNAPIPDTLVIGIYTFYTNYLLHHRRYMN